MNPLKNDEFSLSIEEKNREREEIEKKVQAEIDRINNQRYIQNIFGLYHRNDSLCLFVMGIQDKYRKDFDAEIRGFYDFIARETPKSYGLLYYLDGDDKKSLFGNLFQVLVLAKGQVTERFDPFLSPYFPTILDD